MSEAFSYSLKTPLVDDILLLDGITRSGKKYTSKIISHFEKVEMFQYHSQMEQIAYMRYLKVVDERAAAALLQYQTEEQIYNRMIGRNLNLRLDDETSIEKSPYQQDIRDRIHDATGQHAVERYISEGWLPFFHLHNAMLGIEIFFEAFPGLRLVYVHRHPVDLVAAWLARGWGERETVDPLSFAPLIETASGLVPWYARDWADVYRDYNSAERAVAGIVRLHRMDENGYNRLSSKQRQQVLAINLEELTLRTQDALARIETFLNRKPTDELDGFLVGVGKPIVVTPEERATTWKKIHEHVCSDLAADMQELEAAYEQRWSSL